VAKFLSNMLAAALGFVKTFGNAGPGRKFVARRPHIVSYVVEDTEAPPVVRLVRDPTTGRVRKMKVAALRLEYADRGRYTGARIRVLTAERGISPKTRRRAQATAGAAG
jgi:hypothetical protein